jgi:AcrR family transcriptional regulator
VLSGGLTVFARDGYARASIDVIAAEAQVSSRTIYNHFQDKAGLFRAVIQDSAQRVAAAQLGIVDRYLRKVTDLEADLVEFGIAWRTPRPDTSRKRRSTRGRRPARSQYAVRWLIAWPHWPAKGCSVSTTRCVPLCTSRCSSRAPIRPI